MSWKIVVPLAIVCSLVSSCSKEYSRIPSASEGKEVISIDGIDISKNKLSYDDAVFKSAKIEGSDFDYFWSEDVLLAKLGSKELGDCFITYKSEDVIDLSTLESIGETKFKFQPGLVYSSPEKGEVYYSMMNGYFRDGDFVVLGPIMYVDIIGGDFVGITDLPDDINSLSDLISERDLPTEREKAAYDIVYNDDCD